MILLYLHQKNLHNHLLLLENNPNHQIEYRHHENNLKRLNKNKLRLFKEKHIVLIQESHHNHLLKSLSKIRIFKLERYHWLNENKYLLQDLKGNLNWQKNIQEEQQPQGHLQNNHKWEIHHNKKLLLMILIQSTQQLQEKLHLQSSKSLSKNIWQLKEVGLHQEIN